MVRIDKPGGECFMSLGLKRGTVQLGKIKLNRKLN